MLMQPIVWKIKMSFAKDIAAFVNVFGLTDPDFIMTFASIPWESEQERNYFLNELIDMNNGSLFKEKGE